MSLHQILLMAPYVNRQAPDSLPAVSPDRAKMEQGIALIRAQVLPRLPCVTLIIGVVLFFPPLPWPLPVIGALLFGASLGWLSYELLRTPADMVAEAEPAT